MVDVVLNLLLRAILVALGLGSAAWLLSWLRAARSSSTERWPFRLAMGMVVLAVVYAGGHVRLLAQRKSIEEGRTAYARFGDPRLAEMRRAEVRGWILDCSGAPENALARYESSGGVVERFYPLGEGGANLVGGGEHAGERDFTIERLFADELRGPRGIGEIGEIHPAGTDLRTTLCRPLTDRAWDLLRETGRPGAVMMQDVETGAVVAYAATGGPDDPPLGFQAYSPPGSVFKLALAAIWWEHELPEMVLGCPSTIRITDRATIRNSEVFSIPSVSAPSEMLIFSCNTTAVEMAMIARDRLGEDAFMAAYRRFGFIPYMSEAPTTFQRDFWHTDSDDWASRMGPRPSRIRVGEETGAAEWAQIAIGQGPVDATVAHVSRFLQAIGNDGVMLPPSIEWDAKEEVASDADDLGVRVMSEETAARVRQAMLGVVDRGTARRVAPAVNATGWDLGGKTGTAQVSGAPDNGWFAGLIHAPDGTPRYTVVAFLRGGGPGGRLPTGIAAGLTRAVAEYSAADRE